MHTNAQKQAPRHLPMHVAIVSCKNQHSIIVYSLLFQFSNHFPDSNVNFGRHSIQIFDALLIVRRLESFPPSIAPFVAIREKRRQLAEMVFCVCFRHGNSNVVVPQSLGLIHRLVTRIFAVPSMPLYQVHIRWLDNCRELAYIRTARASTYVAKNDTFNANFWFFGRRRKKFSASSRFKSVTCRVWPLRLSQCLP